ncbi:kinase-like domain-containing protein [Rhizophagus irregularis DAOM 181602=DAOM 197198]|nr:kinase-like domain-containing protein [Rhizophagus irregularis DAOM 181602=DAOM 197198]
MSGIRKELVNAAKNENPEAIRLLTKLYDTDKIFLNEGTKRISKFSNWTSGNDNIYNLIQECQMKEIVSNLIPEWIPYNNFQNIEYLTKGGCSEIYTAKWINGSYDEWDSKEQQIKRLENISDFGFCGPADKPLKSIYGNLLYIAPEVIIGKEQTFKFDIHSIAMFMLEISSGQPPFTNYEHNYDLAMNIVNGIRPKIVSRTPLEYKNLMKQCGMLIHQKDLISKHFAIK